MNSQMLNEITEAFGSLDCPNWAFVSKWYDANPYPSLESQLRGFADVKVEIDYNSNTSVSYDIESKLGGLGLFVSLVGKYAYVGNNKGRVQTESELLSDELGRKILLVLQREGIMNMTVDQMKEGIYFNKEQTHLYRVLFSEHSAPWEWYEAGGPGWPPGATVTGGPTAE